MSKDVKELELPLESAHAPDVGRVVQRYMGSFQKEPPILYLCPVHGPAVNTNAKVLSPTVIK